MRALGLNPASVQLLSPHHNKGPPLGDGSVEAIGRNPHHRASHPQAQHGILKHLPRLKKQPQSWQFQ